MINRLSKYKSFNTIYNWFKNYNRYWILNDVSNYPLVKSNVYRELWEKTKLFKYKEIENYLSEMNPSVPIDWIHKLALPTQVSIKKSRINYQHGFILYKTLTNYIKQKNKKKYNVLEVGTAKGFSSLCMAKVLDDQEVKGLIQTIDILPHDVPMYWNSIKDHDGKMSRIELLSDYFELCNKYIHYICGKSENELPKLINDRIHFAFIDGEHFYKNVKIDGEMIARTQSSGDIIIFDDYNTSLFPGVVKAADEICEKYNYKKTLIRSSIERAYLVAEKK